MSCFLLIFMQPNVLMCANLSKPCTLPAKHMGNGQPKPVGGSARKGKGRRSVPLGGQLERSAMRAMYDDSKQRRCPPAAPRSTFADADPGNPLLSRFWKARIRAPCDGRQRMYLEGGGGLGARGLLRAFSPPACGRTKFAVRIHASRCVFSSAVARTHRSSDRAVPHLVLK